MTAALATGVMYWGRPPTLPAFLWPKWRPPHAQCPVPPESFQSLHPMFAGLTLSLMVTRAASTHPLGRYGIDARAVKAVMDG